MTLNSRLSWIFMSLTVFCGATQNISAAPTKKSKLTSVQSVVPTSSSTSLPSSLSAPTSLPSPVRSTEVSPTASPNPEPSTKTKTLLETPSVKLIRSPEAKGTVSKLDWVQKDDLDTELKVEGEEFRLTAILSAVYTPFSDGFTLLHGNEVLSPKKGTSEIRFKVPLKGRLTPFDISSVSPMGEIETERFMILVSNFETLMKKESAAPPKRLYTNVSAMVTLTYYSETVNVPETVQFISTTARASLNYLLFPPHWDLGVNVFSTVIPLTNASSVETPRFLGANFRFGVILPFISEPWRVSLLAGVSYSTMFSKSFGYQNLIWPQIYPTIRRIFKNKSSAFAYFKFASVGDGISFSTDNAELALGAGYSIPMSFGSIGVNLDISQVGVRFQLEKSALQIRSNAYNLGVNVGF